MPSLTMDGPFRFDEQTISNLFTGNEIGNFALGFINENKMFVVCRVEKATKNLKNDLMSFLGRNEKYKFFKYKFALNVKEAYELECKNFHDFGGDSGLLDNKDHPVSPEGTVLFCPYCSK